MLCTPPLCSYVPSLCCYMYVPLPYVAMCPSLCCYVPSLAMYPSLCCYVPSLMLLCTLTYVAMHTLHCKPPLIMFLCNLSLCCYAPLPHDHYFHLWTYCKHNRIAHLPSHCPRHIMFATTLVLQPTIFPSCATTKFLLAPQSITIMQIAFLVHNPLPL